MHVKSSAKQPMHFLEAALMHAAAPHNTMPACKLQLHTDAQHL
jgi:hypothetical protein